MQDTILNNIPIQYDAIRASTKQLNFNMASDLQTGSLLSTLVASKIGGHILEIGTGTGLATSWILKGMDKSARLVTIDNNEELVNIARQQLADDRIEFICEDGYLWVANNSERKFDIIFADAMPGKYELFEEAFDMLIPGGFYIVDDMLPQPNWPEGHETKVNAFINMLEQRNDILFTRLCWSTGIIIVTKTAQEN